MIGLPYRNRRATRSPRVIDVDYAPFVSSSR
jgi:hypothetical protein